MTTQELAGLKVGDVIPAPMPFEGTVQIIGFRYHTSRNNGRTSMVADYVGTNHEGKPFQSFDGVDRLLELKNAAKPQPDIKAELVAALEGLRRELNAAIKLDVKKHYSLMVADAAAGTALFKAKGGVL